MRSTSQKYLWADDGKQNELPSAHRPAAAHGVAFDRIFLCQGATASRERAECVDLICRCFPKAEVVHCPTMPHNRVDLGLADPLARHRAGKRTLVFGVMGSPVRFSREEGNTCPNYWHFSPYGFCPYGCKYCYLAGTQGVWFSPAVKIYLNLRDILARIDRAARKLGKPTAFYLGKLQDGLALDPLTAYSTVLVPFFARHPYARQIVLTKSSDVSRLIGLEHSGKTILSWSINPPEMAAQAEENAPSVELRLAAMAQCAAAGYPVRAVMMPMVPIENWEGIYRDFVRRLLGVAPIQRLTLGGICSYPAARRLMEGKWGPANVVSGNFATGRASEDGRCRYDPALRERMYRLVIQAAKELLPNLEIALCLEEPALWRATQLQENIGRCNCCL
jgi:spore photoproduct lyase